MTTADVLFRNRTRQIAVETGLGDRDRVSPLARGIRMLDTFIQQRIRELVAMTRSEDVARLNLRVAWAKLGMVLGDDRWSAEMRLELGTINNAFETYLGKTELAKSGRGAPPLAQEFDALLEAIRGLERLLPASPRGASPP